MRLNVLMIDDHPPIIEGYKSILSYNDKGYTFLTTTAFTSESAYETITTSETTFHLAVVDITLPPFPEKKITSGEDLIPIIKKHHPSCKIIVITSHSESIPLYKIVKTHQPQGLFIKSDFQSEELIEGFDKIIKNENYYSQTVLKHQKTWQENSNLELDNYNQQILILLSQGVKTKNLPDLLHLSQSAIDKRKAIIKTLLGINKGNDEDILKAARKQGLI